MDEGFSIDLRKVDRHPTEEDLRIYRQLIATDLTVEQVQRMVTPAQVYPEQRSVFAIHWHPEYVPLDLIRKRIQATFPGSERHLIVPTQHNELMTYDRYTGLEIDCHSPSFHRKIQLLIHFASDKLQGRGDAFKSLVAHTNRYRSSQLFEFIDSVVAPGMAERVQMAAQKTASDATLIEFVRIHVCKLRQMIDENESITPQIMLKNKLVRNYFDALQDFFPQPLVVRAQVFLREVKRIVKKNFALDYFYKTQEVMEEARALGACVVIPHPEKFWPVLLDDIDVDGIEVWNPGSFRYTDFLIDVIHRENQRAGRRNRPLLVTMGDDCHMGEKVRDPRRQNPEKAGREIGIQPPWDDPAIRRRLEGIDMRRSNVLCEYESRLNS